MKKSRFTDRQIIKAFKRVEAGLAVPELCRELGISTATFYKWRSRYGRMDVSLMARMKELEAENSRLRKMYVEEKLKAEIVSEALAKWHYKMQPYRTMRSLHSAKQSMSQKGNRLDNAAIERFFGTLKAEYFHLAKPSSIDAFEAGVHDDVHDYNHERIKLGLNGLGQVQYRLRSKA